MSFLLKPKYLILFLIFLFILNQAWWVMYQWPWLIFYFTFVLSFIFVIISRKNVIPSKDELILLAFPAYMFIRGLFSETTGFLVNLSFILFCLSFLYFGREKFNMKLIATVIVMVVFIQSLIGLIEFIQGHTFYITWREERYSELLNYKWVAIGSTAMDSNYLALNILPIIPLCMYLAKITSKNYFKKIVYILIVFFLFVLFLTQSRAAFFSIFILLVLVVFKKKNAFKVTIFTLAFLILYLYISNREFFEDISSLKNLDPSAWIRISIWQSLLYAFLENPIFGIGQGQYNELSIHFLRMLGIKTESNYMPMNMFLGTLAELGIIGFALLATLILNNIRLLNHQIRSVIFESSTFAKYFLMSFILWLIMSFSLDGSTTYLFWILITLPLINKKSDYQSTVENDSPMEISHKFYTEKSYIFK